MKFVLGENFFGLNSACRQSSLAGGDGGDGGEGGEGVTRRRYPPLDLECLSRHQDSKNIAHC